MFSGVYISENDNLKLFNIEDSKDKYCVICRGNEVVRDFTIVKKSNPLVLIYVRIV